MIEHILTEGSLLLVGLVFVAFAVVNNDLTRPWLKRLGAAALGGSSVRQSFDAFADSRVGRMLYGSVLSAFAFFVGILCMCVSVVLLVVDFRPK